MSEKRETASYFSGLMLYLHANVLYEGERCLSKQSPCVTGGDASAWVYVCDFTATGENV